MTLEEYRKLQEQVGEDDAWRLVMALRVREAVRMLEAHIKSPPSDGPDESGWTIRITL